MLGRATPTYNQSGDINLTGTQLGDSISSISINGTESTPSNIMIVGCWDNTVSCFELQYNNMGVCTNCQLQGQIKHDAPVLCTEMSPSGFVSFSAGCDGLVRMWDVSQGPTASQVIGKHDQPVRTMKFVPESNLLITGSWDKLVKVWDMRQPTPIHTQPFPERIYCLDAKGEALVVGTADKMISVFSIAGGVTPMAQYKSPLNAYQLRSISIFANKQGYAVSSIEGRVALDYFSELQELVKIRMNNMPKPATLKSFVFKCHRHDVDIYSVNVLDFYKNNTLLTAGSDGTFSYWDIEAKARLGTYELQKLKSPITCGKFAPAGNMMLYSLSYDWSKGAQTASTEKFPNAVFMHTIADQQEMVRRPGNK